MIHAETRDRSNNRLRNDVRGIVLSTTMGLNDRDVDFLANEDVKG